MDEDINYGINIEDNKQQLIEMLSFSSILSVVLSMVLIEITSASASLELIVNKDSCYP